MFLNNIFHLMRFQRCFSSQTSSSRLDRILKLDKVQSLPAEEIRKMWLLHHRTKPYSVSSVLSPVTYDKLASRGKESPFFVLPLPELSLVCF